MPSHLAMDKMSVWNYLWNVVLCTQGKKNKRESKLRQLLGVFEFHQVQTNSQTPLRNLQPIKHSIHKAWNLQNSKEAVAKLVSSETMYMNRTWSGHFQHVLHVEPNFCDWHGQKNTLQVGSGEVWAPFIFCFCLILTKESASTACQNQQFGLWWFFFPNLLLLVVKGSLLYLNAELEPMKFLSLAEAHSVPGRQESNKKMGKQWIYFSCS